MLLRSLATFSSMHAVALHRQAPMMMTRVSSARMMSSYGADTPFILLARIRVKPDKIDEYMALAKEVDDAVKETEPDMLHHTFDQDPDDPTKFVWSEVYKNDAAFLKHLTNPPVGEYLAKHAEFGDTFTVEVYGTVGDECRAAMESTGLPLKIFETKLGYSRVA